MKTDMRIIKVVSGLFLTVWILFASSCAPSLQRVGREQGCDVAEEYIHTYIVNDIREERFKRNLPYRAALMPLSVSLGLILNYISQTTIILPIIAPTGLRLIGSEFKALGLQQAVTYSPLKGSKLDRVDDSVIAHANFDLGMCYYESGNFAQASTYFENLLHSSYAQYIGEQNLLFLLGDCYYMLSLYDRAVDSYKRFMDYCRQDDDRIPLVKQRIKAIDALHKKGLWGIEQEE